MTDRPVPFRILTRDTTAPAHKTDRAGASLTASTPVVRQSPQDAGESGAVPETGSLWTRCSHCDGAGRVLTTDAAGLADKALKVGRALVAGDTVGRSPLIFAIKELRTATGIGLKEAKDLIDAAIAREAATGSSSKGET